MRLNKKVFWLLLFTVLVFCCLILIPISNKNLTRVVPPIALQARVKTSAGKDSPATSATPSLLSASTQTFLVRRVIDGDTIVVSIDDRDETVRLLGIDTPETVDPRKLVQCFGTEASDETKSLLDGRRVGLQNDLTQSDRDKYGRLLRYVFRDDGLFINEFLVQKGFAYEYTYLGVPYKYQTVFRADQTTAQLSGAGLWATNACGGKR